MVKSRDFRRACHTAARDTIIGLYDADGVASNFHAGVFGHYDRRVIVACTRDPAVLATAEPEVHGLRLTFVDVPELAAAVATFLPGVRVLTTSELNGPFRLADWPHVRADDIKYWRPGTLGEALFNYWY